MRSGSFPCGLRGEEARANDTNWLKSRRRYFAHVLSGRRRHSSRYGGYESSCDRSFASAAGAILCASHSAPRHQVLSRIRHRLLRLPSLSSVVVVNTNDVAARCEGPAQQNTCFAADPGLYPAGGVVLCGAIGCRDGVKHSVQRGWLGEQRGVDARPRPAVARSGRTSRRRGERSRKSWPAAAMLHVFSPQTCSSFLRQRAY